MSSLAVVIPTRNRPRLLERAVNSVPPGVEVVIVDDASTDETPGVGRRLVAGRGTYRRLEDPRGPCYARNVGAELSRADLLLFLDDDDMLLPGGEETIISLAEDFSDDLLFLHNCRYPDGRTSIDPGMEPQRLSYADWLRSSSDAELKPVVRRELFDRHRFEDTGASGEGLLWGKVIREHGAVVGAKPTVYYDTVVAGRLTSGRVLLRRAGANARIADRWLEEFGDDFRRANPARWRRDLRAAVLYNAIAGRRSRARELLATLGASLPLSERAGLRAATFTPGALLRAAFLLYRGEWRS